MINTFSACITTSEAGQPALLDYGPVSPQAMQKAIPQNGLDLNVVSFPNWTSICYDSGIPSVTNLSTEDN